MHSQLANSRAGGVKARLDPGWPIGEQEVNNDIQGVDLANGQQHVVTVTRTDQGRRVHVKVRERRPEEVMPRAGEGSQHCYQAACGWPYTTVGVALLCAVGDRLTCVIPRQVDDYPVESSPLFNLDESADTKLDNPKYIYFGRNGKAASGSV